MYKTFAITLFILTFSLADFGQEICSRYTPAGAGFSIYPPVGWRWEDKKDDNYKRSFGPASTVFVANLNFKEAVNTLPLNEFVDISIKSVLDKFNQLSNDAGVASVKLISQGDIVTTQTERGVKVVFLADFKGLLIDSTQYYFDTGTKKLILTFTCLESEKASNDKLFDQSVKTLQIDR